MSMLCVGRDTFTIIQDTLHINLMYRGKPNAIKNRSQIA